MRIKETKDVPSFSSILAQFEIIELSNESIFTLRLALPCLAKDVYFFVRLKRFRNMIFQSNR
ncbi:MAG: hypothetical protein EBY35_12625 [Rhodobacteraceae bacterium]|nr:hypothetical protein [Paracoccaceae bacterium]